MLLGIVVYYAEIAFHEREKARYVEIEAKAEEDVILDGH